ncbi:MAG: hypothetical protein UHD09_04595 [Bifidobacterium sp.]|nr:hypothetical protein [Bifidobacterium sp.]
MADVEIGDVNAATIDVDALVNDFNSRVDSNYGGYFPDSRGTSYLAADFVKGAAQAIAAHMKDGDPTSFVPEDTDAESVDDLRSGLKIDSYCDPLLTIAKYLVNDWLVSEYGDNAAKDPVATAFRAYADDVFAPAPKDDSEKWMNACAYLPEGPELAAIYNDIAETNVEHLSGKDMQDGAFLIYDGTKYDEPTKDPDMRLFE